MRKEKKYDSLEELLADAEKTKKSKLTIEEIEKLSKAFAELQELEAELEAKLDEFRKNEKQNPKIDPKLEKEARKIIERISKEAKRNPLTPDQLKENKLERLKIMKRLADLGHRVNFTKEELEDLDKIQDEDY